MSLLHNKPSPFT